MYIFCASPGRSGTRFFAEMFKYFTDIPSFHEPLPKCVNDTCRMANTKDIPPFRHELGKLRNIYDTKIKRIEESARNSWYFESNQMFIKSFSWLVLEHFENKVGCIYIDRPLIDFIMSYSRRGKRRKWPLDFQIYPDWAENEIRLRTGDYGFYETIAWNWFEVKDRYSRMRGLFKKTYEFDFRKINDIEEWQKLFDHFEVPMKRKLDKIPSDLYRHQSGYTEEMIPGILKHIRDNWKTPGVPQLFPTDMEQLAAEAKK